MKTTIKWGRRDWLGRDPKCDMGGSQHGRGISSRQETGGWRTKHRWWKALAKAVVGDMGTHVSVNVEVIVATVSRRKEKASSKKPGRKED
ncbi:hypothetical protein GH714_002135 [Hevea brasiliensis]|uniref:Uncharacterized protein n=1 Tax=Hevea brasiliensis TaxID=3981 RepID=A0A6A6KHV9_HEVBR|nr:hypothetical protein GH714_002135 [Hevea brasiliensis]